MDVKGCAQFNLLKVLCKQILKDPTKNPINAIKGLFMPFCQKELNTKI